ncbi:2928_t:CDS:1, partial [Cetraspora pellucida]
MDNSNDHQGETSSVRDEDNELNEDELISQSFVPSILPGQKEDSAINSVLSRMQQ